MTSKNGPSHVVVDGSNIATEGRSIPSLAQLSDAVASFMEEHPDAAITVVVDATFGHRIDKREVSEFEAGISNNELVAPPAGAIGRGDAFVLSIAQKANASILSNDSFQEFHADYDWLFDEGRLIGGKPVPHVGWVFVNRSPVRGPVSRKAMHGARAGRSRGGSKRGESDRGVVAQGSGSPLANEPMPVPKSPPPGRSKGAAREQPAAAAASAPPAPRAGDVVNELMPFLEFVEHHPIGTSVNGIVETYSSHGAYIAIGTDGVRGYIPLRLMADPPPTSARKVMQIGEAVTVVVVSFAAARRSIDCALPDMAEHPQATVAPAEVAPARSPRRGGAARTETMVAEVVIEQLGGEVADTPAAAKTPARRRGARKATAPAAAVTEQSAEVQDEPVTTTSTKRAASKAAPRRAATKQAPAEPVVSADEATTEPAVKRSATKAPAARSTAAKTRTRKAPATATATTAAAPTSTAAKSSAATEASATTASATTASATTAPVKKAAAKKAPAKKAAAKKAPAKKAAAKKAAAKKAAAKKAPAATSPAGEVD